MAIESVLDAARQGLAMERLRMEAASRNIAAANAPIAPGAAARNWKVDSAPGFEAHLGTADMPTRAVHDPDHPMADAQGMVLYPAVDLVGEMTTLMTASRSYEANVRSFNVLRSMMLRALEIGSK